MISEDEEVKDLAVASDPPVLSSDPNYSSPESHQAPSRAHCDGFKNKRRKHYFFSIKKYVEKIIPSIMLGCTLRLVTITIYKPVPLQTLGSSSHLIMSYFLHISKCNYFRKMSIFYKISWKYIRWCQRE